LKLQYQYGETTPFVAGKFMTEVINMVPLTFYF